MPSKALRLHNAISMSLWEFLVVICEAFLHINRGKLFPSIGSFFSKEYLEEILVQVRHEIN